MIDADTQGQAGIMLGIKPEKGLAEVISGSLTLLEGIVEARKNLWVLAGGRALAGTKRLIAQQEIGGESMLKDAIEPFEKDFDFIIIDTSPGWDVITVNALYYVDEILVPASLDPLTLEGLKEFEKSVKSLQKYNQKLKIKYVVPTFLDGRIKKSSEILKQIETYYEKLICQPIRYNTRLAESPAYRQTIFEYAPNSNGASDYLTLTERILSNGRS